MESSRQVLTICSLSGDDVECPSLERSPDDVALSGSEDGLNVLPNDPTLSDRQYVSRGNNLKNGLSDLINIHVPNKRARRTLMLQDHDKNGSVSYRNIWMRKL